MTRPGHVLFTGAGKDATLALARARSAGLEIARSLTLIDAADERVRFHGVSGALVEAQARALGMEPRLVRVPGPDVEADLVEALERLAGEGAAGVVFGNVHLADVRAWYEERTRAAGLDHVEPLWAEDPAGLAREVVDLGYRALITCVELTTADPAWLGCELDRALLGRMEARGVDPCGERGEYHTFVFDGPGFTGPVPWSAREAPVEREGFRILELRAVPGPGGADASPDRAGRRRR